MKQNNLKIEPITFTHLNYIGESGSNRIAIEYNLSKLFTQNIMYAAYYEPQTPQEISAHTGIPESLVKEEVYYLENNGFMEQVKKNKYLTLLYITDLPVEVEIEKHRIFSQYAKIVCEQYIPELFKVCTDLCRKPISKNIYYPHHDFNFFMWSVVMFACGHMLNDDDSVTPLSSFFIKGIDGSPILPLATIKRETLPREMNWEKYQAFGEFIFNIEPPELYPMTIWTLNTYYDDRIDNISQIMIYEFSDLYDIMANRIKYEKEYVQFIDAVYNRGFIVNDTNDYVNMVITSLSKDQFKDMLPAMPKMFSDLSKKLDQEIYQLIQSQYPSHLQELTQALNKKLLLSNDLKVRVLENLLLQGTLLPLPELQRKTVNTIMFSSVLPGEINIK